MLIERFDALGDLIGQTLSEREPGAIHQLVGTSTSGCDVDTVLFGGDVVNRAARGV